MQNIGGFFEKFKSKFVKEVQNLVFISETIKKHTGIEVDMKNIAISNGLVRIKTTSLEKNVIFIKKTQILNDLERGLYRLKIRDIQ